MKILRIGISQTVHSLPLVRGLEAGGEGYRAVTGRPGDLADQLRHGKLDAALIPSVEFFRGVGDAVVPGLCLASRGADSAFRFLSEGYPENWSAISVDKGSRSGVAALRLLLGRSFRVSPDFRSCDLNPDNPLEGPEGKADGALLIGDAALSGEEGRDLGRWWRESFHRPLVHSLWAWRGDEEAGAFLAELLGDARRRGEAEREAIAAEEAARLGLPAERVADALAASGTELDGEALEGLRLFHRLCVEEHLAGRYAGVERALDALAPARAAAAR